MNTKNAQQTTINTIHEKAITSVYRVHVDRAVPKNVAETSLKLRKNEKSILLFRGIVYHCVQLVSRCSLRLCTNTELSGKSQLLQHHAAVKPVLSHTDLFLLMIALFGTYYYCTQIGNKSKYQEA